MDEAWRAAAERGDAAALRAQLDAGADVNALDRYGQTALMLAARLGRAEAVDVLIAAGAELDRTAKYRLSALMLAVINDHEPVVARLLAAGADTALRGSGAPGFAGKTARDLAADLGRDTIVARLADAPTGTGEG